MRRSLASAIAFLFAVWLASIATALLFIADLTSPLFLIGAIVAQIGVFGVSCAMLLVTNTRRPRGIDPDWSADQATAESLRPGVMLGDGRLYGRRQRDDRSVVDRLSDILEEEAAKRPGPARTPDWAIDLAQDQASAEDDPQGDRRSR